MRTFVLVKKHGATTTRPMDLRRDDDEVDQEIALAQNRHDDDDARHHVLVQKHD